MLLFNIILRCKCSVKLIRVGVLGGFSYLVYDGVKTYLRVKEEKRKEVLLTPKGVPEHYEGDIIITDVSRFGGCYMNSMNDKDETYRGEKTQYLLRKEMEQTPELHTKHIPNWASAALTKYTQGDMRNLDPLTQALIIDSQKEVLKKMQQSIRSCVDRGGI